MTFDELKAEFAITNDGDIYGNCMAWWFAVADVLYFERDGAVPDEWEFNPGAAQEPEDTYHVEVCREASTDDLIAFGDRMKRLRTICAKRGWDY